MDFGFWWAERVEASGSGSAVRCPMGPSALSLDHGFAGIGTLGRRLSLGLAWSTQRRRPLARALTLTAQV